MPLMITFGVVVVASVYGSDDKKEQSAVDLTGKTAVGLLPMESTLTLYEAPIASITFFDGDPKAAAEFLRQRVANIAYRNPWLGGWLQRSGSAAVELWYDESSDELAPGLFRSFEPGEVALSRDTPYETYGDVMGGKGIKVKCNADIVGRDDESLWRVSLIPDADRPDDRFALVVSMSHMCGDAHTFYQVYNMLNIDTPILELNPKRKVEFRQAVRDMMGETEACYIKTVSTSPLWETWLRRYEEEREIVRLVFRISNTWVEKQKAEASANAQKEAKNQNLVGDGHLLSSNDVITSWFWRTVDATVGLMAFNFRNRLPMCTDLDAGNYQNPIPYLPEDYSSPVLIRNSLKVAKRFGASIDPPTTIPDFQWDSTFSVATNWTRLHRDELRLQGGNKQDVHLPLYDVVDLKRMPNKMSLIVLFRIGPGADQIGAFVMAPRGAVLQIQSCGIVEEMLAEF